MSAEFDATFARLRQILETHRGPFALRSDGPRHFALDAPAGPAALKAWGGKMKRKTIPVAWVETGKAYVSYHLMGVYGNPKLMDKSSPKLKARMQGKSCFNFKAVDDALFTELDELTARSLACFTKAGFVIAPKAD